MSTSPADRPAPSSPPEITDLPGGIRGTDPEAPQRYTAEDVAAATALLETAAGQEPELAWAATDEQLAALDGYERRQFVAMPWLDEHPGQRRSAAVVALRALLADERVAQRGEGTEGDAHWWAAPEIIGCLLLRRTAAQFTTAERTVQTPQGPQVHRLHCYVHETAVLEEEVAASGIHRFTALTPAQAAARLAALMNPLGEDGREGAPVHLHASELAAHPLAHRLADTRALTVLTRVRTADGSVQQLHVHATGEGVLTMEALDPGAEDPRLEFRPVDAAELRALAAVLVGRAG